jgi:hypothetical protein
VTDVREGDRVRGHDNDYDLDYDGRVIRLISTPRGEEAVVRNEVPGPFWEQVVALPLDQWEKVE